VYGVPCFRIKERRRRVQYLGWNRWKGCSGLGCLPWCFTLHVLPDPIRLDYAIGRIKKSWKVQTEKSMKPIITMYPV